MAKKPVGAIVIQGLPTSGILDSVDRFEDGPQPGADKPFHQKIRSAEASRSLAIAALSRAVDPNRYKAVAPRRLFPSRSSDAIRETDPKQYLTGLSAGY